MKNRLFLSIIYNKVTNEYYSVTICKSMTKNCILLLKKFFNHYVFAQLYIFCVCLLS